MQIFSCLTACLEDVFFRVVFNRSFSNLQHALKDSIVSCVMENDENVCKVKLFGTLHNIIKANDLLRNYSQSGIHSNFIQSPADVLSNHELKGTKGGSQSLADIDELCDNSEVTLNRLKKIEHSYSADQLSPTIQNSVSDQISNDKQSSRRLLRKRIPGSRITEHMIAKKRKAKSNGNTISKDVSCYINKENCFDNSVNETFPDASSMTEHTFSEQPESIEHSITTCHEPTKDTAINVLPTDILLTADDQEKLCCTACSFSATRIDAVRDHFLRMHGPKYYACGECEKTFAFEKDLKQHRQRHDAVLQQHCNITEVDMDALKKQYEQATNLLPKNPNENGRYQCPNCDFEAKTKMLLREHYLRRYTVKHFHCDTCGMQFALRKDMRKHVLCHMCPAKPTALGKTGCLSIPVSTTESNTKENCLGSGTVEALLSPDSSEQHAFIEQTESSEHSESTEHFDSTDHHAPTNDGPIDILTTDILITVDDLGRFHCPVCNFSAVRRDGVREHFTRRHGPKDYACTECETSFAFKKDLKKHLQRHHMHDTVLQQNCKITKADEDALKKEYTQATNMLPKNPNENGRYQCPNCEYQAHPKTLLREHYLRRHTVKHFHCDTCGMRFALRKDIMKHALSHMCPAKPAPVQETACSSLPASCTIPDATGQYFCSECDYKSLYSQSVNSHYSRQHAQRPYKCTYCDKIFAVYNDMKRHSYVHSKREFHICHVCGKTYHNPRFYRRHIESHEKDGVESQFNPVTRLQCEICGKLFQTMYLVNNHKLIEHFGTKEYFKCPVCNKQFIDEKKWKDHSLMHLGITQHKCVICGRAYATRTLLNLHKKLHVEQFRFNCHLCTSSYQFKYKLNAHMKFHEKKKDFFCHFCGKGCTNRSELVQHIRVQHEDIFPYHCKLCSQRFKFVNSCKQHIMKIHKDLSFKNIHDKKLITYLVVEDEQGQDLNAKIQSIKQEWLKDLGLDGQNSNDTTCTPPPDDDQCPNKFPSSNNEAECPLTVTTNQNNNVCVEMQQADESPILWSIPDTSELLQEADITEQLVVIANLVDTAQTSPQNGDEICILGELPSEQSLQHQDYVIIPVEEQMQNAIVK